MGTLIKIRSLQAIIILKFNFDQCWLL